MNESFKSSFVPYRDLYSALSSLVKWVYESGKGPIPCEIYRGILEAKKNAIEAQALPDYENLVEIARSRYETEDVEIDDEPQISLEESGAFVSAWVFVPYERAKGGRR